MRIRQFALLMSATALCALSFSASAQDSSIHVYDPNVSIDMSVLNDGGMGQSPVMGSSSTPLIPGYGPKLPSVQAPHSSLHVAPSKRIVLKRPALTSAPAAVAPTPTEMATRAPAPAPVKPAPAITAPPVTVKAPTPPALAPAPAPAPSVTAKPAPAVVETAAVAPQPVREPVREPAPAPVKATPPPAPASVPTPLSAIPNTPALTPPPPPANTALPGSTSAVEMATPAPTELASLPSAEPAEELGDLVTISFGPSQVKLADDAKPRLDSIANRLKGDAALRLNLLAYAGGEDMSTSASRRTSLSRALAIRSYLIDAGVKGTRIDVRALGNKSGGGEPNRVDITISER